MNVAFIFARGGSKGVLRKNLRPLCNEPLLGHSIKFAQKCRNIDALFVSTEDEEIADYAGRLGASIIQRPLELASDTAAEWLSWQHAVEHVLGKYQEFERFISLPCTSPLRIEADVDRCIELQKSGADVVVTITPSKRSPWFNMVSIGECDNLSPVATGNDPISRRQDAPPTFDLTTLCYVSSPQFILHAEGIWNGKVKGLVVPEERSLDIDTEHDFVLAECLMKIQAKSSA